MPGIDAGQALDITYRNLFLQFNYTGGYVEVFVDGACLNNGRGGAQVHL